MPNKEGYQQIPKPMEADVSKTGKNASPESIESTLADTQLPEMTGFSAVVAVEEIKEVSKNLNASAVGKTTKPKDLIDVFDGIDYFDTKR